MPVWIEGYRTSVLPFCQAVLNAFCVDIAPASFPESDIASAELRLFHWALARNFPSVEGCGFEEAKANTVPMSKN